MVRSSRRPKDSKARWLVMPESAAAGGGRLLTFPAKYSQVRAHQAAVTQPSGFPGTEDDLLIQL